MILCGSGISQIAAMQRIGRAIRSFTSKDGIKKQNAAIIEFYDDIKYLKKHSEIRHEIYSSEKSFDVKWIK